MRLVIADTGPLNYLILIGQANLLPALFEKVLLPATVRGELASIGAPLVVRAWVANPPGWIEVYDPLAGQPDDPLLSGIDAGERQAIQLALALHANLVLMDDRQGVSAAERKGLRVMGTLGVLDIAARQKLVDFSQAVERLRQTNFRMPRLLLDALLDRHRK